MFNAGIRPAIDVGISVSRVGGNAQIKAMKKIAGMLRLDLAQYRELEAFAKFGSDLDKATQRQLTRGERMVEILKQGQYEPLSVEKQIAIIWAGNSGHLDEIPIEKIKDFEDGFLSYLETSESSILADIVDKSEITDEIKNSLEKAVNNFKKTFA